MVVGITGGIGSGKSFVAKCFLKYENTVYYHADEQAKELMHHSPEIRERLISQFGKEVFLSNQLNRSLIASVVFNHPDQLAKLNNIVHPAVRKHFQDFVHQQQKNTFILYENAILFETKSHLLCDDVITITAPVDIRIQRVVQRDQITKKEVLHRMQNQWDESKKILLSNYVILNIDKNETLLKVKNIHNILTKRASFF